MIFVVIRQGCMGRNKRDQMKQDLNAFACKIGRYCCFLEFLDQGWKNASVFMPFLERQYAIS